MTMEKTNVKYNAYIKILEEELRPAMGCTEQKDTDVLHQNTRTL